MRIRKLSREVISHIAAGEVVERPASVAKELVENSIDAQATDIRVELQKGGTRLVRVIDDGTGIPADEVELAFEHHSTSKLSTAEDLLSLTTLGFRGEALASIAAVSQVTILTRAAGEEVGTLLRLQDGKVVHREKKACPRGTVISVEKLFQNTPARRKFLRSDATERKHAVGWVTSYALAYPELRFTLIEGDKIRFQSLGSGQLFDVLVRLYSLEDASKMLLVESPEGSAITIEGYISPPGLTRASSSYMMFFVNRRWVHSPMLVRAVEEARSGFFPRLRHPVAVIDIRLPPEQLDINVHPAKKEVAFLHPSEVFSALQKAVRVALKGKASLPAPKRASIPAALMGRGGKGGSLPRSARWHWSCNGRQKLAR